MITAEHICWGVLLYFVATGQDSNPGPTLRQSGAQTREPRHALYELRHTLSQATFSNVAAHLWQEGPTMSLDLLGPAISLGFHPALH